MRHSQPLLCAAVLGIACSFGLAQGAWLNRGLATAPPQFPYVLEWSPATQTIWYLGTDNGTVNETWQYDGNTWSVLPVAGSTPSGRFKGCFDRSRGRMIAFSEANETWEFDGSTWTQGATANVPTPTRTQYTMAYDPLRGETLLFGGSYWDSSLGEQTYLRDLWVYDGSDWSLKPSAGPVGPAGRGWSAMAYDPSLQAIVLHGGWYTVPQLWLGQQTAFEYSDSFAWNGTIWQALPSGGGARKGHTMAYDTLRGRMMVAGGSGSCGYACGYYHSASAERQGNQWFYQASAPNPGRNDSRMAYDERRQRFVLVGGFASGASGMQDTWEFFTPNPAAFTTFGTGCSGAAPSPNFAASTSLPWTGSLFEINVANLPAAGVASFTLGSSRTTWNGINLPFSLATLGAPGCALWIGPEAWSSLQVVGSTAAISMPVPNLSVLVGAATFGQVFALDPAANALGVITSGGFSAVVGVR